MSTTSSRLHGRFGLTTYHFCESSLHRRSSNQAPGFTLVEILVAATILAVAVGGVASTLSVGLNAFRSTRGGSDLEAGVNTNLAAIKDVAYRLTCCSGSCTASQAAVNAAASCVTKVPGEQNYYFPETDDSNQAFATLFKQRCDATGLSASLIESLITAINADPASSADLPLGVARTFNTSAAGRNRLVVSYSNGTDTKSYTVIPAVAAWCP